MLLPPPATGADREALRFGDRSLTYAELGAAAGGLAARLRGHTRVAVWAAPTIETCVAVVAGLLAGVAVVPLNPKLGERELKHILGDAAPDAVLEQGDISLSTSDRPEFPEPDGETPALIVYTSGTTGPPKGVVLPRRAIASNLDALASAWEWTAHDVVAHALPLFHVHGLIVGMLGPLRRGGCVQHLGRFAGDAVARALDGPVTMLFGVPTMYHRLAQDCARDAGIAAAVGKARLLVSGSAALPASVHERIAELTGQRVVERYGLTETLMNCSVRAAGQRRPGTVGPPVDGVEVRLLDEAGTPVAGGAIGEIEVRGPNLFLGYLNRPDATAEALRDGWFRTGDLAVREPDGYLRIVGRKATDLIKSGGYKIGAGEVENALLEHPAVAEVAVTGEPDEDLGERVVAWVVPHGDPPTLDELADHVAAMLAPHKRPRVLRLRESLPRNEMGKIMKRALS